MSSEANNERGLSANEQTLLFSDASVDSKLGVGFGACLALTETELELIDGKTDILNSRLKTKQFAATSPTQLEIATVLWALQEVTPRPPGGITLFTDSQSIIDLPRRRTRLERSGFSGTATGKVLKHAELYRAFYQLQDRLAFKLVKLKGHSKRADKTRLDRVFAYVDKASRKALRRVRTTAWMQELEQCRSNCREPRKNRESKENLSRSNCGEPRKNKK